jgi:UDP-glucose 4-epimerase
VVDLCQAHLLALKHLLSEGESKAFNLGNGAGFSVRQVIAEAQELTRLKIPIQECPRRAGDPPCLVASSQRIREELGWTPAYSDLKTIIQDAWNFEQRRIDTEG